MPRLPLTPGIRLIDWLVEGVEVLPEDELVKVTECSCIDELCFHEGIFGPLSDEQKEKFCKVKKEFDEPIASRVKKFYWAHKGCLGKDLKEHLACMCQKLSQDGLEMC